MKRNCLLLFVAYALSAVIVSPVSQWCSTTECSVLSFKTPVVLYLAPLAIGALAAPFVGLGLFFKGARRRSAVFLSGVLLVAVGTIAGSWLGSRVRMGGIQSFVDRTAPLIAAIDHFAKDRSVVPSTLGDLVPAYLSAVPHTGMSAYPNFEYVSGDECRRTYGNNPWALIVDTPHSFMNWDRMLYLPDRNYLESGHGVEVERIGDWAYIHE